MKKILLILMAAATFSAALAEAYNRPDDRWGGRRPGRPGPGRPGPGYPPGHGGGGHPGYPPPPPAPAPPPVAPAPGYGTIQVPVYVNRYFVGNDRLDLAQYINLAQYRGLRLVAIDFTAQAQFNTALIDVVVNGFQVAPTTNLNGFMNPFRVFPNQHLVIGYGADSIVLYTRGNLNIQNVVLQLSR